MKKQTVNLTSAVDLTNEFFRATQVQYKEIDTSLAVIPAPRNPADAISDQVDYWLSVHTAQLRNELRAEIANAKAELADLQIVRAAATEQQAILSAECSAVRRARRLLDGELERVGWIARQARAYGESGLCTPSRNRMTGRG